MISVAEAASAEAAAGAGKEGFVGRGAGGAESMAGERGWGWWWDVLRTAWLVLSWTGRGCVGVVKLLQAVLVLATLQANLTVSGGTKGVLSISEWWMFLVRAVRWSAAAQRSGTSSFWPLFLLLSLLLLRRCLCNLDLLAVASEMTCTTNNLLFKSLESTRFRRVLKVPSSSQSCRNMLTIWTARTPQSLSVARATDLLFNCDDDKYNHNSRRRTRRSSFHQRLHAAYGRGGTGAAVRGNWAATLVWKLNHVVAR